MHTLSYTHTHTRMHAHTRTHTHTHTHCSIPPPSVNPTPPPIPCLLLPRSGASSPAPPAPAGEARDLGTLPGRDPPPEALYNMGALCDAPGGLYGPLGGAPAGVPGQWAAAAARWFSLAVEKAARDTGHALGRVV